MTSCSVNLVDNLQVINEKYAFGVDDSSFINCKSEPVFASPRDGANVIFESKPFDSEVPELTGDNMDAIKSSEFPRQQFSEIAASYPSESFLGGKKDETCVTIDETRLASSSVARTKLHELKTGQDLNILKDIQQLREEISKKIITSDSLTPTNTDLMRFCSSYQQADTGDDGPHYKKNSSKEEKEYSECRLRHADDNAESVSSPGEAELIGKTSQIMKIPSLQEVLTEDNLAQENERNLLVSSSNSSAKQHSPTTKSKHPLKLFRQSPCPILEDTPLETTTCSPSAAPPRRRTLLSSTMPRSVSFNDQLLSFTGNKAFSENGSKKDTSASLLSSGIRRLWSTPGRLQSVSTKSKSYQEVGSAERSSDGSQQGKKSFKNLTSSLVRKLSFKTYKGDARPRVQTDSDATNGLRLVDDSGLVSYEQLVRLFECPGCQQRMSPPFIQCRKGHLVCDKCKSSYKGTCPVCKQRVTDSTNYMMEQVYQLLRFPCQFMKFGCPEFYPPRQKTDHEHFCCYRPVICHFEGRGCDQVLPLSEMKQHLNVCQYKTTD